MITRRAFTLIELLVVIAIIATLASLLFPVLTQARSSAKGTADTAQARQLGVAWALYLNDSDDFNPPLVYRGVPGATTPDNLGFFRWPWLIEPYTNSKQIFWSPLDTSNPELRNLSAGGNNGYVFGLIPSWGYNQRLFSPDNSAGGYAPIPNSVVELPSEALLLASSIWWIDNNAPRTGFYRVYPPAEWAGTEPLNGLSYGQVWPRLPGNRVNVLFSDGRVKGVQLSSLQQERWWTGKGF